MKLSQKQQEVVNLAVQGLTNKEIAKELGVEPETVKSHVRVVIQKTGLRRTTWWKLNQEGSAA